MKYAFLKIAQVSSYFSSSSQQFKTIPLSSGWISYKLDTLIGHILAYFHLKFRDVYAEFEGVINDYIAKMVQKL